MTVLNDEIMQKCLGYLLPFNIYQRNYFTFCYQCAKTVLGFLYVAKTTFFIFNFW